jgi:hypothetical protein
MEKLDIIIEGANHIIQGQGEGIGLKLNNVKNVVIKGFGYGIFLNSSSYCSILGTA